jgi:hypothetical protein
VSASGDQRRELDATVVSIELTLASIVQGVALFFLIDNARAVATLRQSAFWLYVAAGLIVILIFWSRSIMHTLTLIRWPLEFGHNFLYIACAMGESLLFTRLTNPRQWFVTGAFYAAIAWLLFIYDLRLVRAREGDSRGDASSHLYAAVKRDQRLNILLLMPGLVLLNAGCAFVIYAAPERFAVHHGHVWLGGIQLIVFAIYLAYVLRFFKTLLPLISKARQEWHRDSA